MLAVFVRYMVFGGCQGVLLVFGWVLCDGGRTIPPLWEWGRKVVVIRARGVGVARNVGRLAGPSRGPQGLTAYCGGWTSR